MEDDANRRGRIYIISNEVKKLSNYDGDHNAREVRVTGLKGEVVIPPHYIQGVIANVRDKNREVLRMHKAGKFLPLYLIDGFSMVEVLTPDQILSSSTRSEVGGTLPGDERKKLDEMIRRVEELQRSLKQPLPELNFPAWVINKEEREEELSKEEQ